MNETEITEKLSAVFRDVFEDPSLALTRDTTADDVEDWDSARMVDLIIGAEERFGVRFTTRETDSLKCVGDFVDLIARKVDGADKG